MKHGQTIFFKDIRERAKIATGDKLAVVSIRVFRQNRYNRTNKIYLMKGDIVRIQNSEELLKRLRAETDERVKSRLLFLNAMANHGISYEKASDICGLSMSTGYVWIRKWNAEGYKGLKDRDTRTGRPPRLNDENMTKLKEILKSKAYWTTKEVVMEIKTHFDVGLSEDQTIKILRSQTAHPAASCGVFI